MGNFQYKYLLTTKQGLTAKRGKENSEEYRTLQKEECLQSPAPTPQIQVKKAVFGAERK